VGRQGIVKLAARANRIEVIVADLEHFPEGQVRTISMPRRVCRRRRCRPMRHPQRAASSHGPHQRITLP